MSKPRLLDLFCKAGGASKGYMEAGFLVFGVDIEPQPNYIGHGFHQGDALEFVRRFGHMFDVIAASPPCQAYSSMRKGRWKTRSHPDLVKEIRMKILATGLPYVIENVLGAPLVDPIMLCGSMFGLETDTGNQLRRHRLFEMNFSVSNPPDCRHNKASTIGVYGGGQHPARRRGPDGHTVVNFGMSARKQVMGIDWMNGKELSQAIPPAYTRWIGDQLMRQCFPNRTFQ